METHLDHIVIGATSLEQGAAFVERELGVAIPEGGRHPAMGTHNRLMQLGGDVFLEVIAIDPAAPAPPRPRWYGLDDPHVRGSLAMQPRLLTWVVNTPDIEGVQARTPFDFGTATPLSRGTLSWLFALPGDGRLLAGGMLPYLIQWRTKVHPAVRMADLGCRLTGIEIHHPHVEWVSDVLSAIGADRAVALNRLPTNATPYLVVHVATPGGDRILRS